MDDGRASQALAALTDRVKRVSDKQLVEVRGQDADTPGDELTPIPSNGLTRLSRAEIERMGLDAFEWGAGHQYAWYEKGGHYYRCRDITAGARRYGGGKSGRRKRFWNGWSDITATDAFAGAPQAIDPVSALEQEYNAYPNVMTMVEEATGVRPHGVSADRGFATKATYEYNTRRGIGAGHPVARATPRLPASALRVRRLRPSRRSALPPLRRTHHHSRAGLGFYFDGDEPRIRARCRIGATKECSKTQSIACSREWRFLQPFNLTDETYHQLAHAHSSTERVHLHLRGRYTQGGKETIVRHKRLGLDWQRLSAAAGRLLEWFRLCLRHGWLGSHKRRNKNVPSLRHPGERLSRVIKARIRWALDLPYGDAARRVGLGRHGPPGAESPLGKKT